jgi:hypothetical protein
MTTGLHLHDDDHSSLRVSLDSQDLLRYVYAPSDPQLESPRPYFHPLTTIGGDPVSLFRPHDHVWHRGIAWSLPNIGREGGAPDEQQNFWGGVTYLRGREYVQLPNNGAMRHRAFTVLDSSPDRVQVGHELDWITEPGERWFTEQRDFHVTVADDSWVLTYTTQMRNVSGDSLVIGSPTTQGRENAGYGGLFWRGPRSFSGGTILAPAQAGSDELMGIRAPWLGFTGQHDDHGRWSTLVFVDDERNPGAPTTWFARSGIFACICPAPFFDTEVTVKADETLTFRYAVVIADGAADPGRAAQLAANGTSTLMDVEP